jgi:predicted alpha-1,2-mannosidase
MSPKLSDQPDDVSPAGAVEIRNVTFSPTTLNSGDLLNISITLFNGTAGTLATQEPNPGFVYDEGDTFRSRGFTETRDAFRVGIDFDGRTGIDHPYRWGLGAPLAPGQTATITGAIRLRTARTIKYWAGFVRELVAWLQDRQGEQTITVNPAGAVTITNVTLTPTTVSAGGLLNASITVRNDSAETLQTQGPDSGFVYDEGDTFRSRGFTETRDAFRVGIDFDGRTGIDHPYRWGLGAPLAPGQTTTITGAIRLRTARTINYWCGLVREKIAWLEDRQGTQSVTVMPAPTCSFVATPSSISAGESATLRWNVTGASSVSLDEQAVPHQGTKVVSPPQTTAYTLHIVFTDGSAKDLMATVTVSMMPAELEWDPRLDALGVKLKRSDAAEAWRLISAKYQDETESGNTHHIYFKALNANDTPKAGLKFVVDWVGRETGDQPAIVTSGANGETNCPLWAILHPELQDGPYFAFVQGQPSDMVSGMGLPLNRHVNFLLTFKWGRGAAPPPPIYSFNAHPTSIQAGQSATLQWNVTRAQSVTLDGQAVAAQGSRVVTPKQTTTYTLHVVFDDGSTRDLTATVTVTPVEIASFTVTPNTIAPGTSATLEWNTQDADQVTLDGESVPVSGSRVVTPTQTTTYTLHVVFTGGTAKDLSVTLTVEQLDLIQYVDPFIGTDYSDPPNSEPGSDYPGAVVPFGMVQFSPDTPAPAPASYRYRDTKIEEFSMTHFNGGGCANNKDIGILPITGGLGNSPGTHWTSYSSDFTKGNESASPGYYKTRLDRYGVTVELTTTIRTGMARFTYPATAQATVLINTSRNATGNREGSISISGNRITGDFTGGGFCRSTKTFKIYFAIEFDRMPTSHGTWFAFSISPGSDSSGGRDSGGYVTFDTTANPVVQMKIALSYVSIANAQQNLATENPGWSFSTVQSNARAAWNNILSCVRVSGGTTTDLKKFYTALYHVFQSPNVASDVNGQYMGFDNAVHTANGMTVYQNYSGWDIYRSWAALVAMLAPDVMADIVKSMILDGQQGGALPKWSQQNQEHFIMTGDPGPIILSSAYAFGVRNFDTAAALALMNKSGSVVGTTIQGEPIRGSLGDYLNLHYVPGNASVSLEYSASDFAIAQFAKALGDTARYNYFMNHAQWWRNVFNPASGYIHPRNSDGSWLSPFDPKSNTGFTEGNAAQYTWMVPHNYAGLINLMGGKTQAIQRLDYYFTQVKGGYSEPYFHIANEPGHNQPWAYNFAGAPWNAQAVVRRIMTETFSAGAGGVPGNDDLGAMSAWYVWAALGMFPVTPGADTLALHGPLFTSATIKLAGGKVLQINGAGAEAGSPYIQNLTVNGASTTRTWLHFSEIANGATLDFTMGSSPNKSWGINPADVPPSFNDGS